MLKCHLILIFLAIYFHNIGDETFALSIEYPDQYPEICQAPNEITCKHNIECNSHVKIVTFKPRIQQSKGVCKHLKNNSEK